MQNFNTVLCSYRERFYREQIVIFREIISAPIGNKPKIQIIWCPKRQISAEVIDSCRYIL